MLKMSIDKPGHAVEITAKVSLSQQTLCWLSTELNIVVRALMDFGEWTTELKPEKVGFGEFSKHKKDELVIFQTVNRDL